VAPLYSEAELGCATGEVAIVWGAWQPFERGAMLWRSDNDEAYVLFGDGRWLPIEEGWNGEPPSGRGEPPANRVAPERGFGWVWSTRDDVFQQIGWATDREKGFCAAIQQFERGFLLRSSDVPSCTPDGLYNHAAQPDWRELALAVHENGWRGSDSVIAPAPTAAVASAAQRPSAQGRFTAARLEPLLDGSFDEWPGAWMDLPAVVFGEDNWAGADDLAARFQVGWGTTGLYVALQVTDDAYRAGPVGSDMWQGDGLEVNFDRELTQDYADPTISTDDFQIGLSYGPEFGVLSGYRWLPFDRESALTLPAAVVVTAGGYNVEALIPGARRLTGPCDARQSDAVGDAGARVDVQSHPDVSSSGALFRKIPKNSETIFGFLKRSITHSKDRRPVRSRNIPLGAVD
jgi:hypothetical protein